MREQLRVADLRRSTRRLTYRPQDVTLHRFPSGALNRWMARLKFVEACEQQRETTLHFAPVVAPGSWS